MKPKPIKEKIEEEIRTAYGGILGEEQINATIKWWNKLLDKAVSKVIEEIIKEIEVPKPRAYKKDLYGELMVISAYNNALKDVRLKVKAKLKER